MIGDFCIRWTARLAVTCYVARLICDANQASIASTQKIARWWWTVGCMWFVAHVAAAFHFQHAWSHSAAFDYTAKRTAEMTGWNSGSGLYVNEAFLCLWVVDTILWWRDANWTQNRLAYWTIQGIFAFLMLQATAIFGPRFWIPIALIVMVILAWIRANKIRNRTSVLARRGIQSSLKQN